MGMRNGRSSDLIPAFADETGETVIWEDRSGVLYGYNRRGELVEVDENGNEIRAPRQQRDVILPGSGRRHRRSRDDYDDYDDYDRPRRPRRSRDDYDDYDDYDRPRRSSRDAIGIGHSSGSRRNRYEDDGGRTQRSYKRETKADYGRDRDRGSRNDEPIIDDEIVDVAVAVVDLNKEGYRPMVGNEFPPFFNEETESLEVIIDESSKTYKFIIKGVK